MESLSTWEILSLLRHHIDECQTRLDIPRIVELANELPSAHKRDHDKFVAQQKAAA